MDIWETNSIRSFSTKTALTVPRLDMICEISRISSSSNISTAWSVFAKAKQEDGRALRSSQRPPSSFT